jgi:osmoprotectant transport system ATP-binding protein
VVGLIEPTGGHVEFDGRAVTQENIIAVRRRMGYVIQSGGLFPHLTARQNILLIPKHLGSPDHKMQNRLLELCGLTHFPESGLDRYPLELSGGQQQRVGLMRALALDPDVLLLDEPLGALDPLVRTALQTELRDIFKSLRKTVILVTHDMAEAAFLADEILLFREGRLLQRGSLDNILHRPEDPFVSDFINAQRNMVKI